MSRVRSAPTAKPARSTPRSPAAGGARGVYVQKPKSDVFVAMLGVALGAMVLGTLLLLWVMYGYNFQVKPTVMAPGVESGRGLLATTSETFRILNTVRL